MEPINTTMGVFRKALMPVLEQARRDGMLGELWETVSYYIFNRGARVVVQYWRDNKIVSIQAERFDILAEVIGSDIRYNDEVYTLLKKAGVLRFALQPSEQRPFSTRSADDSVVQTIESTGRNIIEGPEYFPVNCYVSIEIDRVRFRNDKGIVDDGRYIRISVPHGRGDGAVVLPIDLKTGDVQLVTQHRYPVDAFVTELPRGFADACDANPEETGKRESEQETGNRPIRLNTGLLGTTNIDDMIFPLNKLYTDDGKLADNVHYFLMFVDKADSDKEKARRRPGMESPVWVRLGDFYRAVITGRPTPIELQQGDRLDAWSEAFPIVTAIDEGRLDIRDAFTCTAANAARSHLCHVYPWLRPIIAEAEASVISGEVEIMLNRIIRRRDSGAGGEA